jgi:hypothetical protein
MTTNKENYEIYIVEEDFDAIEAERLLNHVNSLTSVKLFDSAKSLLNNLNKYDPDQPRDERGRFGSGGDGSDGDSNESATAANLPKPVGEQQYGYEELSEIATPIENGMVVRAVRETMATMSEKNGFNATPTVVSKEEFDKFLNRFPDLDWEALGVKGEAHATVACSGSGCEFV